MHPTLRSALAWGLVVLALATLVGCAAGAGSDWKKEGAEAAGFWAGLWHGALLVVTLIVSFFTDQVSIYETHNVGLWYDLGFVLGALAIYGGGGRATVRVSKSSKKDDEDWEEIGRRVEAKVKAKVAGWVESGSEDVAERSDEWRELASRFERAMKEKVRRWVEEEEARQRGSGREP